MCIIIFQRVKVPYGRELRPEPLASRKVVSGDRCTEGSETAKLGTDEQEQYMRPVNTDECPQQHDVLRLQNCLRVDAAEIE